MNLLLTSGILLLGLAACQPGKTTQQAPNLRAVPPASQVASAAAAQAAVTHYLSQQPNRQLYQPDSARVLEVGGHYQVLVPRTDWVGRLPNRAAFEVDKATGAVRPRPVK
ncbi:MAG: hypothetical protein ACRYFK_14235 [Janthinobacterium lividum]